MSTPYLNGADERVARHIRTAAFAIANLSVSIAKDEDYAPGTVTEEAFAEAVLEVAEPLSEVFARALYLYMHSAEVEEILSEEA